MEVWLRWTLVTLSVLCLLAMSPEESIAAFEGAILDARAASMGDCWSASESGVLSLTSLPPCEMGLSLSISYSAPYGLRELEQKSIAFCLPIRGQVAAIGLFERGGSLCKETTLSTSLSCEPGVSTRVSISFAMYSITIDGCGVRRFFGLSAGARLRPIGPVGACIGLGNMISSSKERALPSTFLFGLLMTPAESVILGCELRKVPGTPGSFHVGGELKPERGIMLRCGLQTEPVELTLGFAVRVGQFSLETSSSLHSVLGRTDILTLSFGKKEGMN